MIQSNIKVDLPITWQNISAMLFTITGIILIFVSFFAEPVGEISGSVLTILGEIFVFIGSVWTIDNNYRQKFNQMEKELKSMIDNKQPQAD